MQWNLCSMGNMRRSNILKSCAFIARGKSMIFLSDVCFEISMISKHRTAVQHSFVFRNFYDHFSSQFLCVQCSQGWNFRLRLT